MSKRSFSGSTGMSSNQPSASLTVFLTLPDIPAYANVAFNLQDPNKVSKIVESEYGFHIIQLIEKRGDRIKTRHILLKPHIPEESLTAGMARLDSIADDIRNGKFSFEEAASVLSQDKDTRNNHGLLPNPNTNTSKFEMQELPPEIAKVVDKMKVGEISEAFTMIPQKTGKEECFHQPTMMDKMKDFFKKYP